MKIDGKRHAFTLSFIDTDLERDFNLEQSREGLRLLRLGLVLGIAMWILLAASASLAGIYKSGTILQFAAGIMAPFVGVLLVLTFWATDMGRQQWIGAIAIAVSGIVAEYQAWLMNFAHYGAGIFIFIGFVSFILFRLRFFVATIALIPMFVAFLWFRFHGDGSLLDLGFATLAISLVALGGYRIENSTREAFYQRKRVMADRLSLENEAREKSVQEFQALAGMKEMELLSQELHDTVAQKLAYISMAAESLSAEFAPGISGDVERRLRQLARVAAETQVDVRDIISGARSTSVISKGLLPTLLDYLVMLESEYGMRVELNNRCIEADLELQPSQKVDAFKIVQEALNNSRKHSGVDQGRLALSSMKDRIRFEISDEGKGFDPTARAANNHYGLDIMRARAQQSGGIFSVKSTPGMGVRIILEYPIPTRSQDSVPSPTATNPEGAQDNWHEPAGHGQAKGLDNSRHPASILVVDDHDLFREGLCGLLRLGGFNVVGSVASAEIGLVLARNSALDIVLMDIQMRGMDGIQATARFKDEFPSIRIILLTGSPYPGDVLRATQVGASAFLNKSVQASELFETIVEVLQGQARFGPEIAKQILANYSTEYGGTSPLRLIEPLNVRQREVLKLVAQGLTYKEIGTRLHLAESTIKFHMGDIVMLLHVRNKAEAARVAREAGM